MEKEHIHRPPDQHTPLDVLEHKLTSMAARIAATEAEWMANLADYDRRKGWSQWGCSGAAHWLSWKCGMSPSAARERLRVAVALTDLPQIRSEFAAGRLSYSKVQSLTRVANEFNQADLAVMAVNATGAQLARICAGYRRSQANSDDSAKSAFALRSMTKRRNYDGTTTYSLRVLDSASHQIDAHIEKLAAAEIDDAVAGQDSTSSNHVGQEPSATNRRDAIAERGGVSAIRADAAVALLTGESGASQATPAQVTLVVEETANLECTDTCAQVSTEPPAPNRSAMTPHQLSGYVGETQLLASASTHRFLCDPRVRALVEDADTKPLALGRSTRVISRQLRRALNRRDSRCCQFPGCNGTLRLHAHHIVHWADGGATDIDNLILVCHFHHHLVHEGGWSIDPATRNFLRPDGQPVSSVPEHLRAGVGESSPRLTTCTGRLEPDVVSSLDLPWTTALLHHNEALERSAA